MGEGEYMMFDNNFNVSADSFHGGGGSRLLIVSVDEAASIASLTWELQARGRTNDRRPPVVARVMNGFR